MTSARQIAANRTNAQKSTGPRTAAGKARAKMNALQHGLAALAATAPAADAQTDALVKALSADRDDLIGLATELARAEMELRRVRAARQRLERDPVERVPLKVVTSPDDRLLRRLVAGYNRGVLSRDKFDELVSLIELASPSAALDLQPDRLALPRLLNRGALERYERRALSKRRTAIRRFDAALQAQGSRPGSRGRGAPVATSSSACD